jgi:ketosteroid isomerase-like protein
MLLIAAFLTVTAPARGQDADADAAKEVARLSQQINDALVKGDTSFLKGVTADDFLVIGHTGRVGGKDSTFKGFKEGSLKFFAMDDSELKVRLYGDAAIVNGRRMIKYKSQGQERGGAVRFTRVLVRRGGRWQIASEQSTPIADQPGGSSGV